MPKIFSLSSLPPAPGLLLGVLASLALLTLLPVQAQAAGRADRAQPMQIESDALRYEETSQRSVFIGNVRVNKGSIVMRGARLEVKQDAAGQQLATIVGSNAAQAFFRQQREGLGNVQLQLADALQQPHSPVDCVVLNMVLHHFAAPAEAMRQLSPLINSGGHLLITELCSHNQAWAREACGDLWLGFEQDDLARWAEAAGLRVGESLYLGLKNGFQIQVRHFAKP